MPADWCIALGHPDFAAPWRELVDVAECEIAAAHGLAALWDEGIGDSLPSAAPPFIAGDIAVVHRAGLEAGAIFTGARWAIRTAAGISCLPLPESAIVKAWRP